MLSKSAIVITVITLFTYLAFYFHFSVDLPFQDDFLLIQFVEPFSRGAMGGGEFITELFKTFNDHKPVIPRLIAVADYLINGHLNFRSYLVLVSINIVLILYFLYLQFKKTGLPFEYFVPIPLLFLQPLYNDVAGWALTGLQHTYLTLFVIGAILFASTGKKYAVFGAIVCCFLATFSHGNGILSFTALLFFYLCFKAFRKAMWVAIFMCLAVAIYLWTYEAGQANSVTRNPVSMILYQLGFIGSSMAVWTDANYPSILFGAVMLVFMVSLVIRIAGNYMHRPFTIKPGTAELLSLFVFILASATVISIFRAWAGLTIPSRFQLYASLSIIIFYILLLQYHTFFRKTAVLYGITLFSLTYCGYSYFRYTEVMARKRTTFLADLYNWKYNRRLFSVDKMVVIYADFYLRPAYEHGIFKTVTPFITKNQLDSSFTAHRNAPIKSGIYKEDWTFARQQSSTKEDTLTYFQVSSTTSPAEEGLLEDRFLVLRSVATDSIFLMPATPKKAGRIESLTSGRYYKDGFHVIVRNNDLSSGQYELGVLSLDQDGETQFFKLEHGLHVENEYVSLD